MMQRNWRHWNVLALVFAVGGCVHSGNVAQQPAHVATQVHSPYESYLPQAPLETNRVEYAGFSIVRPTGWTTHPITIEDFLKDSVIAEVTFEGQENDDYNPRITVQRLGPGANKTYRDWLTPGRQLADGCVKTREVWEQFE